MAGDWPHDRRPDWTGSGFIRGFEGTAITIQVDDVPRTMPYDIVVSYESQQPGDWEDARISVVRPDEIDPTSECAASHPSREQNVPFRIPERETTTVALPDVCLEQGKVYRFTIHLYQQRQNEADPSAQIFIDSVNMGYLKLGYFVFRKLCDRSHFGILYIRLKEVGIGIRCPERTFWLFFRVFIYPRISPNHN